MLTAVCTSDNHLGAYYARFRPDRMELRRQRLQQNFARVVDAAIERRAHIFLHAGDLFDRPDPRNSDRLFVARQVRRLVDNGVRIFAIAGNHDRARSFGYDGAPPPHQEIEALGAIQLFPQTDDLRPFEITLAGQNVCIWGMSSDFGRPAGACPLEMPGAICSHRRGAETDIVLLHYGVEGWMPPQTNEPCLSLASLQHLDTDAICVGHLHRRSQRRLDSGAVLLNPGATEHINFGEESLECGFWALQIWPGRVQAEYVPLPTQPMRTLNLELDSFADPEESLSLLRRVQEAAHPDLLLRVRLHGKVQQKRFQDLDLHAIAAGGSAGAFHCQVETDGLTLVDEWSEVPLGYGVSFDVRQELQATLESFLQHHLQHHPEDPEMLEVCRLAGERLHARYDQLTGGAR